MLTGLDKFTNNINFKKVTRMFILISALLLIIASVCLFYLFREKVAFTFYYFKIDRQIEHYGINDSIRGQLNTLAESTSDIKDIFLLDKDNNVLYSAKNSDLAKSKKLMLTPAKGKRSLFQDINTPNIYYKVVKSERLLLTKDFYKNLKEVREEYNDDVFYKPDYATQKVYFLTYFIDSQNGNKIFVINDIKPIQNAEPFVKFILALLVLIFSFYWILIALWVYKDANKRKLNAALWGLLILITNIVGLIVYTIYKQNNQTCYKCGSLQSKQNTFCSYCGTRINESCNECGAIITKNDNYCARCGTKLSLDKNTGGKKLD